MKFDVSILCDTLARASLITCTWWARVRYAVGIAWERIILVLNGAVRRGLEGGNSYRRSSLYLGPVSFGGPENHMWIYPVVPNNMSRGSKASSDRKYTSDQEVEHVPVKLGLREADEAAAAGHNGEIKVGLEARELMTETYQVRDDIVHSNGA